MTLTSNKISNLINVDPKSVNDKEQPCATPMVILKQLAAVPAGLLTVRQREKMLYLELNSCQDIVHARRLALINHGWPKSCHVVSPSFLSLVKQLLSRKLYQRLCESPQNNKYNFF